MSEQHSAPSVRQLDAYIEKVAPRDPERWDAREKIPGAGGVPIQVSPERARQLRMVAGMFGRAVGREEMPGRATRSVEQLFTWAALRPFWELAEAGVLRARAEDAGRPLPVATLRILRDCLGMLASGLVPGKRVRLPQLEQAVLKETVAPEKLTALYRELVDMAGRGPLDRDGIGLSVEDRTRLLAIVAVVLDVAARSGELESMRLEDLGEGLATVRVTRNVQKASGGVRQDDIAAALELPRSTVTKALSTDPRYAGSVSEATRQAVRAEVEAWGEGVGPETYALRPGTRVALRRWLDVRGELVAPLEGAKTALWVSLRATRFGPPGLPLRAQGIRSAYARGMTALNFLMAGSYGWEPMPTKLEQLRRSVWVDPLEESEE